MLPSQAYQTDFRDREGDSETEVAQYCEAMGKMYSAARKLKQTQAIASPYD